MCQKLKKSRILQYYRTWLNDNSAPVVMDNVRCGEDVKDISECRYVSMSHNCDHSEDIWLQCKGKSTTFEIAEWGKGDYMSVLSL